MTAQTLTPIKPCAKCGTAARYPSGGCKACKAMLNKSKRRPAFSRSVNPDQLFLNALPGTARQIMDATGISVASLYKWHARLRAAGQVHIGRYEQRPGWPRPIYVRGPGKDAQPPMAIRLTKRLQVKPPKPQKAPKPPKPPKAPKPAKPPKLKKPGKPQKVLVILTMQQAQAAREQINARIAQRAEPRALRLVDVAFCASRTAFPLGAVWG